MWVCVLGVHLGVSEKGRSKSKGMQGRAQLLPRRLTISRALSSRSWRKTSSASDEGLWSGACSSCCRSAICFSSWVQAIASEIQGRQVAQASVLPTTVVMTVCARPCSGGSSCGKPWLRTQARRLT